LYSRSRAEPLGCKKMLHITDRLVIPDDALQMEFVRAGGPGGQNVNKVSTAVRLRFDPARCAVLTEAVRDRLRRLAGRRLGRTGLLTIEAQRHRTQEQNREDALNRLAELIRAALVAPRPRRPTRPTLGAKRRRLKTKHHRSAVKGARRAPGDEE